MRLTGHRRGNPAVRFMIDQSARRRMYSALSPERELSGDPGSEGAVRRWSREFFEQLHESLLPRMAHVANTAEGALHYYGSSAMNLWAFVSQHETALAFEHADSPEQIRDRARRWHACLTTRTAPGLVSPHWGHPVYGARLDPLTGELDVVWAFAGDWCDAVLSNALPAREWDTPRHWTSETLPTSA